MKIHTLTPEQNAEFEQWKSECENTQHFDSDGDLVCESWSHPSQRIELNISPEIMAKMLKDGRATLNKDGGNAITMTLHPPET